MPLKHATCVAAHFGFFLCSNIQIIDCSEKRETRNTKILTPAHSDSQLIRVDAPENEGMRSRSGILQSGPGLVAEAGTSHSLIRRNE